MRAGMVVPAIPPEVAAPPRRPAPLNEGRDGSPGNTWRGVATLRIVRTSLNEGRDGSPGNTRLDSLRLVSRQNRSMRAGMVVPAIPCGAGSHPNQAVERSMRAGMVVPAIPCGAGSHPNQAVERSMRAGMVVPAIPAPVPGRDGPVGGRSMRAGMVVPAIRPLPASMDDRARALNEGRDGSPGNTRGPSAWVSYVFVAQ